MSIARLYDVPSQVSYQDLRGCVEQLQIIEKEVGSLEESQKELADLKDHLGSKHIERNELTLKQEVLLR